MVTEQTEARHGEYMNAKGRYQCNMCTNTYRHFKHLKRHLNSHTHEVVYECEDCGRRYSRGDLLQRHRRKCLNSDDGAEPQYRVRRKIRRRASSVSSSSSGDSDDSGTFSEGYRQFDPSADNTNTAADPMHPSPRTYATDANIRRSHRVRTHPRSYLEDPFSPLQVAAPAPPQALSSLHPEIPSSPQFTPTGQDTSMDNTQMMPNITKRRTEWQSSMYPHIGIPASPPALTFAPQPTGYDSQYFTERFDQMEAECNQPGWISAMDNEASSIDDIEHPVSSSWDSTMTAYQPMPIQAYNLDDLPPADTRPDFPSKNPDFETILVDDNFGGLMSSFVTCDPDFPDFASDIYWDSPPSANYVF